jgi:cytoskeleton protein RodZ
MQMEAIGEKLKAARELKGLTHDQISRDIHISRQYLVALEEEDFGAFPGDTYLIGFLKNYADYLGIEPDELVSMYKHMRIQEQPIPVEQLLEKKKPSMSVVIGVVAGVVIVLVILIAVISGGHKTVALPGQGSLASTQDKSEYFMSGTAFDKRLYQGDSVVVQLQSQKYTVVVKSISDSVSFTTPAGTSVVSLGEDSGLDLTGDSLPDVRVYIKDLDKKDPKKGADVHFELITGAQTGSTSATGTATAAAPAAGAASAGASAQDQNAAVPTAAPASSAPTVILESRNPYPFTAVFNFRGYCMFRWEIDKNDRTERYFHKTESVTVSANNGIRVWLSNAASAKATISNKDFEFGGSGEVVAKSIKWIKDDTSGTYKLTVLPLE